MNVASPLLFACCRYSFHGIKNMQNTYYPSFLSDPNPIAKISFSIILTNAAFNKSSLAMRSSSFASCTAR